MTIVKYLWKFLIGLKNMLVLAAMLLLFGGLAALYLSGSGPIRVERGSALAIELPGLLVDEAAGNSPMAVLSGQTVLPQTEAADLVRAIDRAATDPAIAMITLDLDRFLGGGQANLEAVGAALLRFRATGKRVEAWATAYDDSGYLLASFADRIGIAPQGAVALRGPGGSNLYFKRALDRLHVNVEVFRVGTYKSFVEPFTRTEASAEAKAANQQLADDLWASWQQTVQEQRPALDLKAVLGNWSQRMGGNNRSQALLAKDAGLVDEVISETDWRSRLVKQLGAGADSKELPGNYRRVALADYLQARPSEPRSGPAVAVVHVAGSIVDGEAAPGTAGGDTIASLVGDAIADKDTKAIVVRIDSGGGSVLASEKIRLALMEARQRGIPVVASLGPVAASGGYWVATASDVILASPSTITGSIGVFGIIPTFEGSLHSLGISTDGVRTTELSGQPDVFGGLNDTTRRMVQNSVEDVYHEFLGHVAKARSMPVAKVETMAEGRVWSGTKALDLHLIDSFGGLDEAIAEAADRADLKDHPRVIIMRPPQSRLAKLLAAVLGQQGVDVPADGMAARALADRLRATAQITAALQLASGNSALQASCLECSAYRWAPPTQGEKSLWQAALRRVAGF